MLFHPADCGLFAIGHVMTDEWLKLVGASDARTGTWVQDDKSPGGESQAANAHETFLLEEGLDVLAAYRSIRDAGLRLALRDIIIKTAADYRASVDEGKRA